MYKVIMAPTEGSDIETRAISVAVKLAQRFSAELRLVRVDPAPVGIENVLRPPVLEITERTLQEERLARLHKLEALGTQCRALGEIRVITALEEGPVAPTLRDYAQNFNVDLIVMSSHARGGVRRITLGSVTDYLIRHTNIPVLVVRHDASFFAATPQETVNRIVVPLDGSALAEQILPDVGSLALRMNASVTLLRVLTPQTYSQQQIMQPGMPWWDDDLAAANDYLERAASQLTEDGVAVSKDVVLSDDVVSAIIDYSARSGAQVIAIATRGAGGMSRFVFGTVADQITRQAPVSLLVFHPRADVPLDKNPEFSDVRVAAGS
jgi:nucleotide-binding universal stress UspA family protein